MKVNNSVWKSADLSPNNLNKNLNIVNVCFESLVVLKRLHLEAVL